MFRIASPLVCLAAFATSLLAQKQFAELSKHKLPMTTDTTTALVLRDVDQDGDEDMILHFWTQDTNITSGDTEACLTLAFDSQELIGCDSVRIVPPHAPDTDGDSLGVGDPPVFDDDIESSIRSNQFKSCATEPFERAWPPDFNGDGKVSISDVLSIKPHFGSVLGDPTYDERFDLVFDGKISISDVLAW